MSHFMNFIKDTAGIAGWILIAYWAWPRLVVLQELLDAKDAKRKRNTE